MRTMSAGESKKKHLKKKCLGLSRATISNADLETGLRVAAEVGFVAFEPWVNDFCNIAEEQRARLNELRKNLKLEWLPLMGIQDCFSSAAIERAANIISIAASLGFSAVTAVPGEMSASDRITLRQGIEFLRKIVAMAKNKGLDLYFEMVCFQNRPFNSLEEAKALCEHSGAKLVLDTFHLALTNTKLSEIEHLASELIGLVHLSDAVLKGKDLGEVRDEDRVLPGEGELELSAILGALRKCGYDGIISVEVFHPKYAELPPITVAEEAYQRATLALLDAGWR